MGILWAILLVAVLLIAWAATLLGLPGNWLMVLAAVLYVALVPDSAATMGWSVVLVLAALATAGEVVEFLAGALGAAKTGASRRGVALALAGSVAGGLAGLFVGIPIPIVGPILTAVLFGCVGALVGAMIGEGWKGRNWQMSWQIGKAAFRGRLWGTVVKAALGLGMMGIVILALLL